MNFRVLPPVFGPMCLAAALAFFALLALPVSFPAAVGLMVVSWAILIACVIVLFEEPKSP